MFGCLGLGKCFGIRVWLGYVAGFRGFGCRLRDVEVNGPGMLPGPVLLFALGLYDVTVWGGSLFDNSAVMYSTATGDRNSFSWPGFNSVSSLVLCALSKCSFWICLLDSKKFCTHSMSTHVYGLLGHWKVLCAGSPGGRHVGPNWGRMQVQEELL